MAMSDKHKALLVRHGLVLLRELRLTPEFFAVMRNDDIITEDMMEHIMSESTSQTRIGKFLGLFPRRGGKAFPLFIEALIETHQDHIAKILDANLTKDTQERRERVKRENFGGAGVVAGTDQPPSSTTSSSSGSASKGGTGDTSVGGGGVTHGAGGASQGEKEGGTIRHGGAASTGGGGQEQKGGGSRSKGGTGDISGGGVGGGGAGAGAHGAGGASQEGKEGGTTIPGGAASTGGRGQEQKGGGSTSKGGTGDISGRGGVHGAGVSQGGKEGGTTRPGGATSTGGGGQGQKGEGEAGGGKGGALLVEGGGTFVTFGGPISQVTEELNLGLRSMDVPGGRERGEGENQEGFGCSISVSSGLLAHEQPMDTSSPLYTAEIAARAEASAVIGGCFSEPEFKALQDDFTRYIETGKNGGLSFMDDTVASSGFIKNGRCVFMGEAMFAEVVQDVNMSTLMNALGFVDYDRQYPSAKDLEASLQKEYVKGRISKYGTLDGFALIVSCSGSNGEVEGDKNNFVKKTLDIFNCPELSNAVKLFIFHFCKTNQAGGGGLDVVDNKHDVMDAISSSSSSVGGFAAIYVESSVDGEVYSKTPNPLLWLMVKIFSQFASDDLETQLIKMEKYLKADKRCNTISVEVRCDFGRQIKLSKPADSH